jgi:hypothetical protein
MDADECRYKIHRIRNAVFKDEEENINRRARGDHRGFSSKRLKTRIL